MQVNAWIVFVYIIKFRNKLTKRDSRCQRSIDYQITDTVQLLESNTPYRSDA